MPDDISFLPDNLRKKEQELHRQPPVEPTSTSEGMKFTVPKAEEDDVDVIEIDEGDVDQVLAQEPAVTRWYYRATTAVKDFWQKVMTPPSLEPPPKLPPQFFTPPVKKPISPTAEPVKSSLPPSKMVAPVAPTPATPGAMSQPTAGTEAEVHAPSFIAPEQVHASTPVPGATKPVVQPFEHVPRRVRVIRRVRKPVRVSFVSSEDLRTMRIDIGRRQFTFVMTMILCVAVLVGGTWYAKRLTADAQTQLQKANAQIADLDTSIQAKESQWSQFATLEPKLIVLKKLLDTHVSPTRLFDAIEASTLPTVSYQSFILTPDHKVLLSTSANSFETAAAQVELYSHAPFVKSADAGSYAVKYASSDSTAVQSVDFQLQLTLTDGAWLSHTSSTSL